MEKDEINARLDKLQLPLAKLQLHTEIVGIYSCPEEWKTTDQLNPNTFTYSSKFMIQQFSTGKIQPRQPTEKQLRQQQEASKKKGAPSKKQTKDQAQQQRLKKIKDQQAQIQLKRQQQEAKLSEQERFHLIAEDPFRAFSLKFQNNVVKSELSGKTLVIFEQRVNHDGGQWLYIFKYPALSEEQITKLKKGKPKNLNLNDLNPVIMRAWIDLQGFRKLNQTQATLRCSLTQVDQTPQTSKPNLQKTYILVKLKLSSPIHKQILEDQKIQSSDLIRPFPPKTLIPKDVEAVNELEQQIKIILESIAMQFSQANSKQLNQMSEIKAVNCLTLDNQSDKTKRNQQFLYDFNVRGMYKIMKQRIKKVIVKVCKHKYTDRLKEYPSFTGVTTGSKDQFYSEIYTFLINQYQKVINQIIQEKKQDLHLTPVESIRVHKLETQNYIKQRIDETQTQKVVRLAKQSQNLLDFGTAMKLFLEAISANSTGEGLDLKFQYVKFYLKNNLGLSSKILPLIYEVLQGNKQSIQIILLYALLLFSSKRKNQCKQGWIFLRDLITKDYTKIQYLMVAQTVFETNLLDEQLAQKYLRLAERVALRQIGSLPNSGEHRTNPHSSELPSLKQICSYNLDLQPEQKDEKLFIPLLNLLLGYNILEFMDSILPKISNQQRKQVQYVNILVQMNKDKQSALELALQLYQKKPNYQIGKLITKIAFESGSTEMCEQYLKKLFRFRETARDQDVYLQLATIYFRKEELANAKACLVKLLQYNNNNSAAWGLLGNIELKMANLSSSMKCLREANILNPSNPSIWMSLCQVYLKQEKMSIANTCLINSLKLSKKEEHPFSASVLSYLQTTKFSSQSNRQIASLMMSNIQAVK